MKNNQPYEEEFEENDPIITYKFHLSFKVAAIFILIGTIHLMFAGNYLTRKWWDYKNKQEAAEYTQRLKESKEFTYVEIWQNEYVDFEDGRKHFHGIGLPSLEIHRAEHPETLYRQLWSDVMALPDSVKNKEVYTIEFESLILGPRVWDYYFYEYDGHHWKGKKNDGRMVHEWRFSELYKKLD